MTKHGNERRESSVEDNDRQENQPPVEDNNRYRNKRRETKGNNRKRKESSIEEGNNRRSHTPTSPWYPPRNRFTLNLRTLRDPTPTPERNVSPIRPRTESRHDDKAYLDGM